MNNADAPETPSPVDDAETRAFIAGWNAKLAGEHGFDLALHWWMRERCGIYSAMDLFDAALSTLTPDRTLREALERINRLTSAGGRTFDEMIRDMGYANDCARAALSNLKDDG